MFGSDSPYRLHRIIVSGDSRDSDRGAGKGNGTEGAVWNG